MLQDVLSAAVQTENEWMGEDVAHLDVERLIRVQIPAPSAGYNLTSNEPRRQ